MVIKCETEAGVLVQHNSKKCTLLGSRNSDNVKNELRKEKINQAKESREHFYCRKPPDKSDQVWTQSISTKPAARHDVIALQQKLDNILINHQAQTTKGICPIKEDVYSQAFEELIRQLDDPDRGALLARVRDEHKMTTDAYEELYYASIDFSVCKQVEGEAGLVSKGKIILELEEKKEELEIKIAELRTSFERHEKELMEKRRLLERENKKEIDFLVHQRHQLEMLLSKTEV